MTTTMQETCERAYQRGTGPCQVRTDRTGRLILSGQHVQDVEGRVTGSRVLWTRQPDGRWHSRYSA